MHKEFVQHLIAHGIIGPIVNGDGTPKYFNSRGVLCSAHNKHLPYLLRGKPIPGLQLGRWDRASTRFRLGMTIEDCVEIYFQEPEPPLVRSIISHVCKAADGQALGVDVCVGLPVYDYTDYQIKELVKTELRMIDKAVAEYLRECDYSMPLKFRGRRWGVGRSIIYEFVNAKERVPCVC